VESRSGPDPFRLDSAASNDFYQQRTYKKIGLYKTDYKISSDYDILYRLIRKERIAVTYLPEFIVRMRSGGVSTNGLKAIYIGSKEIYITLKENHESFVWLTLFFRLLFKVKQFIVR
jgi:glycosyltransferase